MVQTQELLTGCVLEEGESRYQPIIIEIFSKPLQLSLVIKSGLLTIGPPALQLWSNGRKRRREEGEEEERKEKEEGGG